MSIVRRKTKRMKPVFGGSCLKKRESDRRISCQDLGQGDCEGRLWVKKSNMFTSKYVYRWCILINECLYFYVHYEAEKAEGIIYLREYRVAPIENFKLKCFYFKIFNDSWSFTFATESHSAFSKWLNKLQISASGILLSSEESRLVSGFMPSPSVSHASSKSSTLKSSTISEADDEEDSEIKMYSESEDSDISEEDSATPVRGNSFSDETKTLEDDSLRGTKKLSAAEREDDVRKKRNSLEMDELVMSAITRILEIERIVRRKKEFVEIINKFLSTNQSPEKIIQFWNKHNDAFTKPYPPL